MAKKLSHVDEHLNPVMVDVGGKKNTRRRAVAEAYVILPKEVMKLVKDGEITLSKGPVFSTAIIAGIMAAKKTGDLIPLCHSLSPESINIRISAKKEKIVVTCEANITAQTGVEMEALTGASVAALTIYDMCKALSHDITIEQVRLIEKTGGKNDFKRK